MELKKGRWNKKTIYLAMAMSLFTLILLFLGIQLITDNLLIVIFNLLQYGLGPGVIIQPILWIVLMIYIPKWNLEKLNGYAL
ncbi:hypothetical protein LV83_04186 [Algoriphagus yeomjeoni]|uniref:Uncharacterized protein n=1 Tax=Algoriphagus yeomjeoni TaxID=291403 RepID=A0A327NZ13_9BACT|nr:hypothetical protein LV83_04186 [Algoriphagus yeomjeoni]